MTPIEKTIANALKKSAKTGQTLYVFATYYKIFMSETPPPFGAAHWKISGEHIARVESTL
jgi:hypothetical protein